MVLLNIDYILHTFLVHSANAVRIEIAQRIHSGAIGLFDASSGVPLKNVVTAWLNTALLQKALCGSTYYNIVTKLKLQHENNDSMRWEVQAF